jgi:hypothetical protein
MKNKIFILLKLLSLLMLIFASCSTKSVQKMERIDYTQKTITVPPGSNGLIGKIKTMLREDGWTLVVYRGPKITEGSVASEVHVEERRKFEPRYRLLIDWSHTDGFGWYYNYDISLIDNNSGLEVLTISGNHGLGGNIVKVLQNSLSSR